MKTIKGPAIFLAQFAGDAAPFNSLDAICGWAASLDYHGVQIPSWDGRLFDLEKAASSDAYCDEVKGIVARHGLEITELSTHLQGQLVAVHRREQHRVNRGQPGFDPEQQARRKQHRRHRAYRSAKQPGAHPGGQQNGGDRPDK